MIMEINKIAYNRKRLDACSATVESLGLYNGKMGLALCYNALYAFSRLEVDKEIAHFLLDEVCINIGKVNTLSFSDGLLGIGWGMAAIQSDMNVNANVKALLANIDDYIYKNVTSRQSLDFSLESGAIGKAFCLYQHLLSDTQVVYYRNIAHKECLILLVTEIFRYLTDGILHTVENEPTPLEKRNTAHAFMLLYHLNQLKLNSIILNEMLYKLKIYLTNYLRQKDDRNIDDEYLMYCYGFVAKSSQDEEMLTLCVRWNGGVMQVGSNEFFQQDKTEVKTLLRTLLTESGKSIWYII